MTNDSHTEHEKASESSSVAPVSVFAGAMATGGSLIIRQAVAFIASVLVARTLGATGKGEIALIGQYAGFVALLGGLGFDGANAYFVGRKGRRPLHAVSDSVLLVTVVSAFAVPALWLFMSLAVPTLGAISDLALTLGAVTIVPMLASALMSGVLSAQGRVNAQAVATTLSAVVPAALVAGLWGAGLLTVTTALASTLAGVATGAGYTWWATGIRRLARPSWVRIRDQVSYAWRNYIQSVAGYLELRQDVFLLGFLATSAAVGVYSTGVALAELVFVLPQTVAVALTARALQEGHAEGAAITVRVTRILSAMSLLLGIALLAIVRPLVTIAFGPEFAGSASVVALLLPGILSWVLCSQLQAFLATHGRLFPLLGVSMLATNLVLNLIVIPRFGIAGAALVTSLTYCMGNGYVIAVFLRSTDTRLSDIVLPRRSDGALLLHALRVRVLSK